VPGTLQEGGAPFQTTHWTLVLRAAQNESTESVHQALSAFCEAYWPPLYAFLSFDQHLPEAEAAMSGTAHLNDVSCYDLTWASKHRQTIPADGMASGKSSGT
jgi:hypothetical protein